MDIRQLRMLRELGELGSVRAVADSLLVTPSAVSQQLRQLQRGAGVPLTRRDGRRLALTEAGQRLAAAAVEVDVALTRAREVLGGLDTNPIGTVSVSAFSSAALAFFGPLAQRFPLGAAVQVSVTDEDVAQEDFPALTASYDVVLGHRFDHTPSWPPTVQVVPLLEEPLDVALPQGHRLAGGSHVAAHDAAQEPWITTHEGFPVGAIIDALATVAGRPVRVIHRVNEFSIAAELVRAGAGLALIPRWTTSPPPGVVLRPMTNVHAARRIDALTRPEKAIRPAVQVVTGALQQIAAQIAVRGSAGMA